MRNAGWMTLMLFLATAAAVAQVAQLPPAPAAAPARAAAPRAGTGLGEPGALSRRECTALAPAKPGEKRVVFLGDSITDGWGRWKGTGDFFPRQAVHQPRHQRPDNAANAGPL